MILMSGDLKEVKLVRRKIKKLEELLEGKLICSEPPLDDEVT
jgi:hypothetical protein